MVRVRFAPSPTGNLHIGGARTALFNWLYAKAKGGKFILRIEDTDKKRSKKKYLDEILNSLSWLGMVWDEIYYQSQRSKIYQGFAEKLLKEGRAYSENPKSSHQSGIPQNAGKIKNPKTKAIVFKVTPQKIKINDLIHGEIEFDATVIKDQVLIKSDGTPTYNFACVVDDAAMNITHVIRGDDHISNTPKQILLYWALGFSIPEFAHLPLILGKDGGRLSKRTGATAISDYRKGGYMPEAIINYLLLLGWSPGGNREVIDIEEAAGIFNIKNANKTAATFDIDKLKWLNNQYIRKQDPGKITELIVPLLIKRRFIPKENFDRNHILSLVKLFQARLSTLKDFVEWADFFFTKRLKFDKEARKKFLSQDLSKEFALLAERIEKLQPFDIPTIEASFRELVKELNLEAKVLIHPVRVALTGKTIGPGLFEVMYYLGKEKIKQRLSKWIKRGGQDAS
jgi:glutamyl-tRNA synthetase